MQVVVPADRAMAVPGRTSSAAAEAMASFSSRWRTDLAAKPGSSVEPAPGTVAPPWTLATSPREARASRSRRTVMSDTANSCTRSLTRTPPCRWTRSRIACCRCRASIA